MKEKCDEGGGGILLGENVGGMAVVLQAIRLHCGLDPLIHRNIDENACVLNSDLGKILLTPDVSVALGRGSVSTIACRSMPSMWKRIRFDDEANYVTDPFSSHRRNPFHGSIIYSK
jgi:hypothetical protein